MLECTYFETSTPAQMTRKFSPYKSDNLRPPFIQLAHIKREKAF